jgi:hypothetical protein
MNKEFIKRFHDAAIALAINSTISYNDLVEMAHMLYADLFSHPAREDIGFEAKMLRMRHGLVRFEDGAAIENFNQACS